MEFKDFTRKDLYEYIKDNNLENEISEEFGKNKTNVSTKELISFLEYYQEINNEVNNKKESIALVKEKNNLFSADKVVINLISLLQAKKIITAEEATAVLESSK